MQCEICQFTAAMQIAERHRSMDIMIFLMKFHHFGRVPFPKEFVCDGSQALLNAAVCVYAPMYRNIDEYADVLEDVEVITRICQDVAYFINVYSKFLTNLPRQVKTIYMSAIQCDCEKHLYKYCRKYYQNYFFTIKMWNGR